MEVFWFPHIKRWRRDRKQYADRLWQINTYSIFLHIPPCSKFNKHCQTWKYLPRNRPIKPRLLLFFAKEWLVVCVIQYTQSFRNFVIFDCLCNWKKKNHSVFHLEAGSYVPASFAGHQRSQHVCVLPNVCNSLVCLCTHLYPKGGTGSEGNRKCLFLGWGQCAGMMHFRSEGFLLLTHTQNGSIAPAAPPTAPNCTCWSLLANKHPLFATKYLPCAVKRSQHVQFRGWWLSHGFVCWLTDQIAAKENEGLALLW